MQSVQKTQRLVTGDWTFLDVEVDAILLFAWSHPELGQPDDLSFWQRALEADLWWKFFEIGDSGQWARRTAIQVYEKWLSMCHEASFESLPLERRAWYEEARKRSAYKKMSVSTLRATIQYHEYLVYRTDDTVFSLDHYKAEQREDTAITSYLNLEQAGIAPLPYTWTRFIFARRNAVQTAIRNQFEVRLLSLALKQNENQQSPLALTTRPSVLFSPPMTPQTSSSNLSVLGLGNSSSFSGPIAQPIFSSSPSSSIDLSLSSHMDITEGATSNGAPSGSAANTPIPATLLSPSAMPASAHASDIPFTKNDIYNIITSPEFAEKAEQTRNFFKSLQVHPSLNHLLYCTTQLPTSAEFAAFCQIFGSSRN